MSEYYVALLLKIPTSILKEHNELIEAKREQIKILRELKTKKKQETAQEPQQPARSPRQPSRGVILGMGRQKLRKPCCRRRQRDGQDDSDRGA